ncbi:MAG TPA: hypothetical protein VN618_09030 [Solirubrobacteraceae bacterium]|nr:hypothetical protein [Solirubrobacteraceae bacterium]
MAEQHSTMLAQNTALTEQVATLTRELHEAVFKRLMDAETPGGPPSDAPRPAD